MKKRVKGEMKNLVEVFAKFHEDNYEPEIKGYHLQRRGHYEVEVRLDDKPVRMFINTNSYNAAWIDACEWVNKKEGR